MKKNKKFLYLIFSSLFVILIIFTLLVISNNSLEIKDYLKNKLSPNKFAYFQVLLANERSSKKLNNDYNVKFLPQTQFLEVDFKKIDLSSNFSNKRNNVGYAQNLKAYVRKPFYLENYQNNLVILTSDNEIFYNDIDNILKNQNLIKIENNLDFVTSLDIFVNDQDIYVSGIKMINECAHFQVARGKIKSLNKIKFTKIFNSQECSSLPQAGRIQKLHGTNSILVSTGADILKRKDEYDPKPQDEKSIFGKILKINLDDNSFSIFSKGHRNILGLYSDEKVILATENGPKGGDEINKIKSNYNYGWPIASYGQKYKSTEQNKDLDYKDNHASHGFEEPIYSFVPSIGISEIIKLENTFSNKWKDNYLIGSLNGNHIYRLKFDNNFNKIIYMEKIFIGERIRDLMFFKNRNLILLALESYGNLGVIKKF